MPIVNRLKPASNLKKYLECRDPMGPFPGSPGGQGTAQLRFATTCARGILRCDNIWGYTRILGELYKLNIFRFSRATIADILKKNGLPPLGERSDPWRGSGQ